MKTEKAATFDCEEKRLEPVHAFKLWVRLIDVFMVSSSINHIFYKKIYKNMNKLFKKKNYLS